MSSAARRLNGKALWCSLRSISLKHILTLVDTAYGPQPPRRSHVGAAAFGGTADANGFSSAPCLVLEALPP
jgi:hypothetical protein